MTDEEMTEVNSERYGIDLCCYCRECDRGVANPCEHKKDALHGYKDGFLAGLEAGRPKWHKIADGDLPKVSGRYWVYTGGEPFTLDFDTEFNSFGYWVVSFGDNWGVRDEDFETVKGRGEDEVIAWCEIPKYTEE